MRKPSTRNIEQIKRINNFSHQTSQSRKTQRDILKKNNNTMDSLRGHQWITDSTLERKKNNIIMRNSNSTNSNQSSMSNTKKSNSKNRSQSNSINNSNTMSLLKKNSSNLHLEICLYMSCNQNTMSMRRRNRGR